jgi:aspartyl-tRNA(Asn)/glutamyl-tRNA(Gln) amidotransferase subunit A
MVYDLSLTQIAEKLKKKEISSVEVTKICLDRIEKSDLNAFNYVDGQNALKDAEKADKMLADGVGAPLLGVPVAVKDNICTDNMPTTCSSKIMGKYIPPYNATVVNKLKEAGAVIVGKTNMDEFAMGSSNETSYTGKVLNPIDKTRVPGGSSGGSAAAVGGKLVYAALGTDTGGSIRQPASFCGVVGIKPTYGLVSRNGIFAFGSSLDQAGPIARTVEDCAVMLNCISGYDAMDSTSQNINYPDYAKALKRDVKGLKLGLPKEYFTMGLGGDVKEAVFAAADKFAAEGAEIVEVSLPNSDAGLSVYYIIACAEAASNLARFDGIKYGLRAEKFDDLEDLYYQTRTEGFGDEVKRRIMLGNYVLSSGYYDAYYIKALKVRTIIKDEFSKAFEKCDLIIGPTSPCTAFKIGEKITDPLCMYMSDIYTSGINVAGLPAISVPCGFDKDGLPYGLQIIAPPFGEEKMLGAAKYYEEVAK